MKRNLFILILALAPFASMLRAQELNCQVQINADQVEGNNQQMIQTLKDAITEFMSNNQWTSLTFAQMEKIDCNLMILVKTVTDNQYVCEATIQASRPVFNASYTTTLLNVKDKSFNFTYQMESLTFQQSMFQSNLSALLAYYAYLILGIDADSYQRLGGSPYYQQCEQIVNMAQTAGLDETEGAGWEFARSTRNRYTIVNELMDEAFKPYRNMFYTYHRLGLDEMAVNVTNARARIAEELTALRTVNKSRPSNTTVAMFLDAKSDELANIFAGGESKEKTDVHELLMAIDPTRSSTFDRIIEQ